MATWQLQQAKAQLSRLIDQAQSDGPQVITRHGAERAVILSAEDYTDLNGSNDGNEALIRHLLNGPKVERFEVTRDRAVGSPFEFDPDDFDDDGD